ncbi:hypothetical protein BC937DRAFT_90515 [Endogone sp. FLAS-F59071]|nr:hypothetical protein BC937DRAFT_90515 [Endogone sp. FLAS-F59071]|eukprot:RUS17031.1 hypothetical protein BC937DRAFT_90515 [Endogone sp. FLAS-F59071]
MESLSSSVPFSPLTDLSNLGQTIVLDESLKPKPPNERIRRQAHNIYRYLIQHKVQTQTQSEDDSVLLIGSIISNHFSGEDKDAAIIENPIANPDNNTFIHRDFAEYIRTAWNNHAGVVISPDVLWFLLLSEFSEYTHNNTEKLRPLFTSESEPGKKKEIIVDGENMENLIIELEKVIPVGTKTFLPDFSTGTKAWRQCCMSAFASGVSPFYSYMFCICGIPSMTFVGSSEDWTRYFSHGNEIIQLVQPHDQELADFLVGFLTETRNLLCGDLEFLRDFFYIRKDGVPYGVLDKPCGHHTRLFKNRMPTDSYSPIVPYQLLGGTPWTQYRATVSGMFSSKLGPDNLLRPEYHTLKFSISKDMYDILDGKKSPKNGLVEEI